MGVLVLDTMSGLRTRRVDKWMSVGAQVLERIVAIVSERAPRGAAAAADQFLGSLGGGGSRDSGRESGSRRQEPPASRRDSSSREDPEVGYLDVLFPAFMTVVNTTSFKECSTIMTTTAAGR